MLGFESLEMNRFSQLEVALIDSFVLSLIVSIIFSIISEINIGKPDDVSESKEYKGIQRSAMVIPFLLSMALIIVSAVQFLQLRHVKGELNIKLLELNNRKDNISNIYDSFGYGGFIHNFKNYVLRADEKYLDRLEKNKNYALDTLNKYESHTKITKSEKKHLDEIRDAVEAYSINARKAKELHKQKVGIDKIDSIIQIDDTRYFKAFTDLRMVINAEKKQIIKEMNTTFDNLLTSFILSLLSSVSFIFLISYFSNRKLMSSKRDALKMARVKSEFLANMSHEIRTPMNGILGMIELLKESELSQNQREMLNTASSSGESLLIVLNDVLDISKIDSGKLELEIKNFNVSDCISGAMFLLDSTASQKRIILNYEEPKNTNLWFMGDVTRIRQVLINFLSNGIKFTNEGSVHIKLDITKCSDHESNIVISVIDSGIGISVENQSKLFKDFSQADSSTTRNFGGTGLGLSISKKLISLMGGEVFVESSPGKGSTFGLQIRLKNGEEQTELIKEKSGVVGKLAKKYSHKILLVEDNIVNQKLASMMFEIMGYECDIANNGVEALEAFKENQNGYTIVFMDMQMPIMDGIEATRRLIKTYGDSCPPIIAMTANAFPEDKEICFEAGMVDFISKPIKKGNLQRVLKSFSENDENN
ncbi:MAG: signal transduction histidine kinase/CheY-like chemotaxis protein [Bacteriovoracaceae bacterium]|jgi:signal transduction histidine kinase/CheY-like chemotaxis protein